MAITYADTQNNPQQNPVYQRQQQIVGYQQPTGALTYGDQAQQETFLQRQQRKYGAQSTSPQTQNAGAAANLRAPQTSTSPVTPNGRLNPNPAPAPQPAPAPATSPDPFTAMGGGVWTGSGWVPRDHPLAQQPGAQPQAATPLLDATGQPTQFPGLPQLPANATYYADDLGNNPFSTYSGYSFNQQGLPTYNAGQINLPQLQGYQPGQISQFQGPDYGGIDVQTQALISGILGNPLSMSAQNVQALKERQKETALSQQRQLMDAAAQSAAQRGLAPGSGNLAGQERRIGDATLSSLIGSYRDIDLAKMQQDQADRMAAAQLGDQFLSSQLGRATQGYQATLAGQQAREQTGQAAADDARLRAALSAQVQGQNLDELFRGYQSQADARKFGFDVERAGADEGFRAFQSTQDAEKNALQRALAQADINKSAATSGLQGFQSMLDAYNAQQGRTVDNRQLDIQQQLGQGGLAIDQRKLDETGRQFDKGYQLDFLRYLLDRDQLSQQGKQFTDSLGLDWFKANSANQANWINMLPTGR